MANPTKPKKMRIYKFAAEYNLSTDSIVEHLKSKNFNVKSHASILTDEMIDEIRDHFQKDIEKSEKHYRKISEFQKSLGGEKEEEVESEAIVEEETPEESVTEVVEEEKEETAEEEVKEDKIEEEEVTENEVEPIVEAEEITDEPFETEKELAKPEETEIVVEDTQEEVEEKQEVQKETDKKEESKEEVKKEKVEIFKTASELELQKNNKGLTIIGKIDLDANKKSKKKKDKPAPQKQEKKSVETKKEDAGKFAPKNEGKKKKRKLKAKNKSKSIELSEEAIRAKKNKKAKKFVVDKREVDATIKRTLQGVSSTGVGERASVRKKKRKEKQEIQEEINEQKQLEKSSKIEVTEFIAVNELANLMNVSVSEVISKCIGLGLMVSINQRLDLETITLIADDFGFDVELQEEYTSDVLEDTPDPEESLQPRSPIVTIMGHVDHGKTSLLDYIRKANVVAGESGGITQHIGAYKVEVEPGKSIAFLDTPGHEAFTAMRARGARVTDIVVLIVAADDAVMPQTVEAINHSLAAGVPIIVAINKVDKPTANVDKIKQQLADRNILVEDWGGKYQSVELSAKAGTNIDLLLEKILLEAELLELKANHDRAARGTVVETELDKGRGITSTILVQKGTMKIGDPFVAGNYHGRVRAMFDERNKKVKEAGPSTPVLVLGFEGAPQAGDTFIVVESEREAREVALKRQQLQREQDQRQVKLVTLDDIASRIGKGELKDLPLIVKGDVDGSVEALADSLMKLSNDEVRVQVIHKGVGAISEGDVLLAAASNAIIVGFHVRPHTNARKLAEQEKVDIRLYNVIYDAINEVKSALEGMLSPIISEKLVATIEVRETFKVPKVGTVAGCYVQDGKITRNNKIRLFRDGVVIYEGQLATLKRFKDDVKEVDAGYECGLNIANFNDIKVNDIIESYEIVETKQKLSS
ncbi:MAG: translation initiation factor IF-2 [Ignavibacteriae bacterium]|nr:MAG: translation initiation factor IF-2 [Ignavibacteriota bacterium]